MLSTNNAYEGLTRLTRLAQLREDGELWLERAFSAASSEKLAPLVETGLEVTAETGEPLGRVLARVIQTRRADFSSESCLSFFQRWLKYDGLRWTPLRAVGLEVAEAARAALYSGSIDAQNPEDASLIASINVVRSMCLAKAGKRDESIEAATEAVYWARFFPEDDPLWRTTLASALACLCERFLEARRFEEALKLGAEAAWISRSDRKLSIEHRGKLAEHAGLLGRVFLELDRTSEALSALEESFLTYQFLASQQPKRFNKQLAVAAFDYAVALAKLGQFEKAREASLEAVATYRSLAVDKIFQAELVMSLGLEAKILYSLKQNSSALEAAREGLITGYRLLREQKSSCEVGVAENFQALALMLHREGAVKEARQAIETAVDLWRRFAEVESERGRKGLEDCLAARDKIAQPPPKMLDLSHILREIERLR